MNGTREKVFLSHCLPCGIRKGFLLLACPALSLALFGEHAAFAAMPNLVLDGVISFPAFNYSAEKAILLSKNRPADSGFSSNKELIHRHRVIAPV